MSLVDITDFEVEFRLLGLYEQEVMKTGIFDYPAQWPLPPAIEAEIPQTSEPLPEAPPQILPESPALVISPTPHEPVPVAEPSSQETSLVSQPVNNIQVIINADELPNPMRYEDPESIVKTDNSSVSPCPLETRRQELLTEQEIERRLFYLFAEELEKTGDLRKFPAVLRPASHT
jgi:hypothetical protein